MGCSSSQDANKPESDPSTFAIQPTLQPLQIRGRQPSRSALKAKRSPTDRRRVSWATDGALQRTGSTIVRDEEQDSEAKPSSSSGHRVVIDDSVELPMSPLVTQESSLAHAAAGGSNSSEDVATASAHVSDDPVQLPRSAESGPDSEKLSGPNPLAGPS